jgi:hypothetical protein
MLLSPPLTPAVRASHRLTREPERPASSPLATEVDDIACGIAWRYLIRYRQGVGRGMHQTTIRFAPNVWREIEREAGELRVSAAQYVRDAALMRLTSGAARRRDPKPFDAATDLNEARSSAAQAESLDAREGSEAVWAQARVARIRARSTREEAERLLQMRQGRAR